jgi:hypothetical protein
MTNRVNPDMDELRADVNVLIDKNRVRVHPHARSSHSELSSIEQLAIVRFDGRPKPDRDRPPSDGVYVCRGTLPNGRPGRAVSCVENTIHGDSVFVITAFEE